MGVFQNNLMGAAAAAASAGGDFYDHQIANSVRWDSGYLKWTPGSAGNRQVWTFSCWVKKAIQPGNTDVMLLNAGTSGNQDTRFRAYWYGDLLRSSSANANYNVSSGVYRDPSAWMHIVWKLTGGTSYQYVNGVEVSTSSVSGDVAINNNVEHTLGIAGDYGTGGRFKGCIAEVVFIDGTAHDPDDFAETKNGVWIPKDPSGLTFGSQGYYLKFESSSDLGNDSSGNNNDWTVVNLAAHDQMLDTPTFNSSSNGGNFATINPLAQQGGSTIDRSGDISEGNLFQFLDSGQSGPTGTIGFNSTSGGKWYWEVGITNFKNGCIVGIVNEVWNIDAEMAYNSPSSPTGADQCGLYINNGNISQAGSGDGSNFTSYGSQLSAGDVVGIALDVDNAKIWFSVNGTFINSGNPAGGSNAGRGSGGTITTAMDFSKTWFPCVGNWSASTGTGITYNFGQDGTFAGTETAGGNSDANGYGNFFSAVPTGFKALCTANLPVADEVDPAQTDDDYPQKLFNPLLYTGNGGTNNITGLGFQPDLVWIKIRNTASNGPLVDSNRGTNKILFSQITDAEATSANLTAFGSDGFSLAGGLASYDPNFNGNTNTYASWNWRSNGGTTSTNSTGSHNATQQVDPSGGFSISTMADTGGAVTVGHGLSKAPSMYIVKGRSGDTSWGVYHEGIGATKYLLMETHSAAATGSQYFNDTAPTSSVLSLGGTWNGAGTLVLYAFANIEGYCKAGSYAANGNADGAFIYTGFRPAYVMIKAIDTGAEWTVYDDKRDTYNESDHILQMDIHDAERTDLDEIDILSNGFKCLATGGRTNQNGKNYIYLAMAKNPFKYATAR